MSWRVSTPKAYRADLMGYKGCIGCEYNPAGGTVEGLGWLVKAADR
jgi:hydroxypyruvate isomerase